MLVRPEGQPKVEIWTRANRLNALKSPIVLLISIEVAS